MSNALHHANSIQQIITKLNANESPAARRVAGVLADLKGETIGLNEVETMIAIQQVLRELRDAAHQAYDQFETDTADICEHIRATPATEYIRCTDPNCPNHADHPDARFSVSRNTNFVMDNRANDVGIDRCDGEHSFTWCNECGAVADWAK